MKTLKLPFISIAAEACGVPRRTVTYWLTRGESGEEPYAEFNRQVYGIRAKAALQMMEEIMNCGDSPGERAAIRSKELLLTKLMRQDLDPPKEIYERVKFKQDAPQLSAGNPVEHLENALEVLQLPPGTMAAIAGKKI